MNNKLKCFLVVAETLNINKSAKKLFLTQQCVSGHIKRLETAYGVKLFHRKPVFSLTAAGETLLEALQKISAIEKNLDVELQEIVSGSRGKLFFGIHSARSSIITPNVLATYLPRFPNVKVEVVYGETRQMEKMLSNNELDLFLGINAGRRQEFEYLHLINEPLYCVISKMMLGQYLGNDYNDVINLRENTVDLSFCEDIPFVFTNEISRTQDIVTNFLNSSNITLKNTITVSDHSLHISLCARNLVACLCPHMMLGQMMRWNACCNEDEKLHAYLVKGMSQTLRAELISRKDSLNPNFILAFKNIFFSEFTSLQEQLQL